MSVIDTKSYGLFKVVGGIAVLLLVGLLVFRFSHASQHNNATAQTEFDGFVADSASRQLLRNAEIIVTLGPYSARQTTDTFGRYSIAFASPSADATMANVEIHATGYGDYKNTIALKPGSNFAEITLHPNANALLSEASMPSDPVVGKAQVFVKNMPSDFMKGRTTYVGTSAKK